MNQEDRHFLRVLSLVIQRHFDLVSIIILVIVTNILVLLNPAYGRILLLPLGMITVLFVPGYIFIRMLLPSSVDEKEREHWTAENPSRFELFVLSTALSLAIVGLVSAAIAASRVQYRPITIVIVLSLVIFIGIFTVAIRERSQEEQNQDTITAASQFIGYLRPQSIIDGILTLVLAISLLLLVSSLTLGLAPHQATPTFTEFYVLEENESGQPEIANAELGLREQTTIRFGISNHEHKTIRYTVIVLLQEVENNDNEMSVQNQEQLGVFQTEKLAHGETQHIEREIEPTIVGEDLQLTYLLYKGPPPKRPTVENSYRDLHLWITVEERDIQDPIEIPTEETNT